MQAARILLAIAVAGAIHLSAPGSADASAVCPPPGTRRHHCRGRDKPRPADRAVSPGLRCLRRGAAACWPGQEIVLTGFVSSPEGLGGTSEFTIEPEWLVSRAHWLSTSAAVDPESGRSVRLAGRGAWARVRESRGSLVRVSGRFDDPVAKTCVVTEENPDFAPTPEQAIQICQTSFVLTSVAPLAAPNTDAGVPGAGPTAGRPTRIAGGDGDRSGIRSVSPASTTRSGSFTDLTVGVGREGPHPDRQPAHRRALHQAVPPGSG